MNKIVILTGDSERDDNLIKCLKTLFPECEIEIHANQPEAVPYNPLTTGTLNDDNLEERLNKLMSFL